MSALNCVIVIVEQTMAVIILVRVLGRRIIGLEQDLNQVGTCVQIAENTGHIVVIVAPIAGHCLAAVERNRAATILKAVAVLSTIIMITIKVVKRLVVQQSVSCYRKMSVMLLDVKEDKSDGTYHCS